jgi:hypothetical protein
MASCVWIALALEDRTGRLSAQGAGAAGERTGRDG